MSHAILPPASPEALSLLSHLRAPTQINGLTLRPITLGSHSLCVQAGSKLVSGAKVAQISNLSYEVLLFLYVHTAPREEVCEAVFDLPALRQKVFALGDTLSLGSMEEIAQQILGMLDRATANIVVPEKKQSAADAAREDHSGKA